MYNRRKNHTLAEDIYLLGYCVVNKLEDRRLDKVLKPCNDYHNTESDEPTSHIVESADIVETCAMLRTAVIELTHKVIGLTNDMAELHVIIHGLKQETIEDIKAVSQPAYQ